MRFGLFGTGWWARDTHGPALRDAPETELIGVWGRNPDKAKAVADALGVPAYREVDALLRDCEAVSVALPPDVQAGLAAQAAAAGKHLLLDKPLALTVPDADRVVDAVRTAGVASVVFFTNRYMPGVEQAIGEVMATGGWDGARATWFASVLAEGGPLTDSTWRVEHGALWDIVPHLLSVTVPVLGAVREVSVLDGPRRTSYLLWRHDSGAVTTAATTLQGPDAADTVTIDFHGESGWRTLPRWDLAPHEAFRHAITDLVAAAGRDDRATRCDAAFARDVVAVIAAAETARAEQRTIQVTG